MRTRHNATLYTHCLSFYCIESHYWQYLQTFTLLFVYGTLLFCGPGSSVGIATELRAGGSGIESQWGRDFPPVQTGPGAHPASCTMGTGSFPGVKCGRDVLLNTHPLLVRRPWSTSLLKMNKASSFEVINVSRFRSFWM